MIKKFFIPIIIFFAALTLYSIFPSNQYTAVDGSLRCLLYMDSGKWELHGNNHMLYPVNVILWSRIISSLFNIRPQDPFSFIRMIELMNSFFASLAVAVFFLILKRVTSNLKVSILGACALAFSNAFIVNAVNSNEPMAGFTISIISVVFTYLWLDSNKIFLGFVGALLLSLSKGIYQSMFFIAPPMILLVILFSIKKGKAIAARNALAYIFFISVSYLAIYFLSHWIINGERSFQGILKKLFYLQDFEIYIRISIAKFLAAPFGMVYGIIHLDNMKNGIRAFFSEQPLNITILTAIMLYILIVGLFIGLLYIVFKIFKKIDEKKKIYLIVSTAGLFCTLLAPIYYSLTYTKLLMQPTAALIVIIALVASEVDKLSNRYISFSFKSSLLVFLILTVFWNFSNVLLKMHFQPSNLKDAKELSERVGYESLVISDWDSNITNLYVEFYRKPQQRLFCISDEMITLKRDKAKFIQRLKDEMASFKARGKKVYFLGVLEKSRSKWRYFLEERLNIDYGLFDEYRRSARLVKKYDKTYLYEY